jgi:nicotinamide riboside transporter PnuC
MKLRGHIYKYVLIAITAVAITVAAVLTGCPVYRIVPLYVSLFVMYLQTKASRFSFLLGGCNAAYYAAVYAFLGLYGMALYSVLVASPIQIVTYIRWKKRAYKHSALLKRLTWKQRIMAVAVFAGVWGILYVLLSSLGSGYLVLDNTVSVIGVASNIASLLYLIEFPYVQCLSLVLNIVLYMQMVQTDPMQWTFLIYTIYALICALISAVYMQKLYNWQRKEKLE